MELLISIQDLSATCTSLISIKLWIEGCDSMSILNGMCVGILKHFLSALTRFVFCSHCDSEYELQYCLRVCCCCPLLSRDQRWRRHLSGGFCGELTWLILPVVICLSQRLSHACLSISSIRQNCEWLIKTVIVYLMVILYMDNHANCLANTCVQTRLRGRVVFISYRTNPGSAWSCGDS